MIQRGVAGAAALALTPGLVRALAPATASGRTRTPLHADRPYLVTAMQAARWLERTAQRRGAEISWAADPDRPAEVQYDLYNGTTGVLPFWVELYAATNEPRALEFVQGSADHLVRAVEMVDKKDAGLYTGLAGVGFALGLAYRVTRDDAHREGARRALTLVQDGVRRTEDASKPPRARWADSTDIISGAAGTGLWLLWAERELGAANTLELARQAGWALMDDAQSVAPGQLRWKVNATIAREYPNFSHGTAGVSFFLARLYQATREPAFLEAARAGASYLQAIATTIANDGRMVYHSTPGNEQIFYMSWCHGPAGTARLFRTLGAITREESYARYVDQLAAATMAMKVPERSPGFWNNVSMCCGNSGVSEFFVARHTMMPDAMALTYAERMAQDTIARATSDNDGMRWVQAENRVSPEAVVAQTGLMQGAAGVGLAMLHLDGAINRRRRAVVLPDDPFA